MPNRDDQICWFGIPLQWGKVYFPEVHLKQLAILVDVDSNADQDFVAVHVLCFTMAFPNLRGSG